MKWLNDKGVRYIKIESSEFSGFYEIEEHDFISDKKVELRRNSEHFNWFTSIENAIECVRLLVEG